MRIGPHGCEHAARRAAERYGAQLAAEDFSAMAMDIIATVAGERRAAALLHRTTPEREIWLVRMPGGPAVRVVYAPASAVIVSVLPPGYRVVPRR